MDWGEKKPVALKIWWRLRKGYVLNINTTRCECGCLCVWISAAVWSSPLHSGNYFYQGLDEGEGKEERERWKEVRAEKGGSRFRERTEKREKQRGEKRLRSPLQWVFFLPLNGGCAHSLNMSWRTTWNLGKSQVQQNTAISRSSETQYHYEYFMIMVSWM